MQLMRLQLEVSIHSKYCSFHMVCDTLFFLHICIVSTFAKQTRKPLTNCCILGFVNSLFWVLQHTAQHSRHYKYLECPSQDSDQWESFMSLSACHVNAKESVDSSNTEKYLNDGNTEPCSEWYGERSDFLQHTSVSIDVNTFTEEEFSRSFSICTVMFAEFKEQSSARATSQSYSQKNTQMGQRKTGIPPSSIQKINAVVMGKDGVGKSGACIFWLTDCYWNNDISNSDGVKMKIPVKVNLPGCIQQRSEQPIMQVANSFPSRIRCATQYKSAHSHLAKNLLAD